MPTVKFSTGQSVNFDHMPTPQDIEEVSNKLGINKAPANSLQQPQQNQSQPESFGQKALDVGKGITNFLFPIIGDVYHDVKGDSSKTFLQQAGDTALSALPFIPGLGEVGEAARGTEAAVEGGEAVAKSGLLSKGLEFIKGSPVAKGAISGYGAGVASNLSQGQSIGESLKPGLNTVGGAILGGATPAVMKGLGGIAKKISGISPQIENELSNLGAKGDSNDLNLYNQYISATKEHAGNLRSPSPLSMAADNVDKAASDIQSKVDVAGKTVGEAKKGAGNIPLQFNEVKPVADSFIQNVADKFGIKLGQDSQGIIKAIPIEGTSRQIAPSELSRIENMANQINGLAEGKSVKNASEVISNINELVDHSKSDIYGHTNDPLEGLLKKTAGDLNEVIRSKSPALAQANDTFSGLKGLQDEISGMAGKNLQKGELLMRRVFSGDKSGDVQDLFGKIKDTTGIDLVKHAVLAKHAIQSVGSNADKTLLEQIMSGAAEGKGGLTQGLVNMGMNQVKKYAANPERIGRNLVKGKSTGVLKGLLTKGAIEASRGLSK